jgi:hypothetical protein
MVRTHVKGFATIVPEFRPPKGGHYDGANSSAKVDTHDGPNSPTLRWTGLSVVASTFRWTRLSVVVIF